MIRFHSYSEGDRISVRIPEGYWQKGDPAAEMPFAQQESGALILEGEIVDFSCEELEVEDTAKILTVRGEFIQISLSWIEEVLDPAVEGEDSDE